MFCIVDRGPTVAYTYIKGVEVVVHQTVVVLDAPRQQKFVSNGAKLPPRCHITGWPAAGNAFNKVNAFIHHGDFLLRSHGDGIFM